MGEATAVRKQISLRKLCILGLLAVNNEGARTPKPLRGRTRLQKLLFLIQEDIKETGETGGVFKFDYEYQPEKFGPADLQLYHDLEFLNAMKLILIDGVCPGEERRGPGGTDPSMSDLTPVSERRSREPALPEEDEEDELSFAYLMGREPEEYLVAEAEDNELATEYSITRPGIEVLERIRAGLQGDDERERYDRVLKTCAEIRSEYGAWPLKTLLRHVYANFPEQTTRSTIRESLI